MTLDEAALILLRGVSGANALEIARGSGVSSTTVERYLNGVSTPRPATLDQIYLFIWRRLNAHLLLTPDEECGAGPSFAAPSPSGDAAQIEADA